MDDTNGTTERWEIEIPTDDVSITRRRRALTPIQVVDTIERNKVMLDGDFWGHYDLFTVALAVIDQVALSMGISAGLAWDETLAYAVEQARRQRPDADAAQWAAVGERVLTELVTSRSEEVPYLAHGPDGPEWKASRFFLLTLHEGADGAEHLRASEQAINIFLTALSLNIEAEQEATEQVVGILIERGAFDSAVVHARQARYQSLLRQEQIRRIVADTAVDPSSHDWLNKVPELLESSLRHVAGRLTAESSLLDAVEERRGGLSDAAALSEANRLVELLLECRTRHSELHSHLLDARARMRAAFDERLGRPVRASVRFRLAADLLEPGLSRPADAFAAVADTVVATLGGMRLSFWPTFADFVDDIMTAPEPPDPGDVVDDPELPDDEPLGWWEAYDALCESLLAGADGPVSLSALCARALDAAGALDDADGEPLEALRAAAAMAHLGHRLWAPALGGLDDGTETHIAVRSGERFVLSHEGVVAVDAEDLVIVPVMIAASPAGEDTRPTTARPGGDVSARPEVA